MKIPGTDIKISPNINFWIVTIGVFILFGLEGLAILVGIFAAFALLTLLLVKLGVIDPTRPPFERHLSIGELDSITVYLFEKNGRMPTDEETSAVIRNIAVTKARAVTKDDVEAALQRAETKNKKDPQ